MTFSKIKRFICIAIMLLLMVTIPSVAYARPVPGDVIVQSEEYPMYYMSADGGTYIEITKEVYYGSECFIARIVTDDPCLLRSCFAQNSFDRTGVMTEVARDHGAVFMVNADYTTACMWNNYVIRDRKVYREGYPYGADGAYFCIMNTGHLEFVSLHTRSKDAIELGVVHSFSFYGGNLFNDGEPSAYPSDKHPRTFMGEVPRDDGKLEYIIVVADGRRTDSIGLGYNEEAAILYEKGCNIGYNLDGGGSSEMVFDGKILNVPSDGHERSDHDFIYVRYGD